MKRIWITLLLIVIMCMGTCSVCFGYSSINPSLDVNLGTGMTNTVNDVLGVVRLVGYIVAVVMVMYAGIKYLMAGAGEKAKVKETLVPMLVGAILVVSATTLATWVFGLGGSASVSGK